MKENRSPHFGNGIVSLIVIFSVLCMAVLALLSWQTAQNQKILAQRAGVAAQEYYAADALAQKVRLLLESGQDRKISSVTIAQGEDKAGESLQIDVAWDGNEAQYRVPVSEVLALQVTLRIENGAVKVLRWATAATSSWEADDDIEVWD